MSPRSQKITRWEIKPEGDSFLLLRQEDEAPSLRFVAGAFPTIAAARAEFERIIRIENQGYARVFADHDGFRAERTLSEGLKP